MSPTRGRRGFAVEQSPAFGVGDDELHGADGQALRDAAALVDLFVFAGEKAICSTIWRM
jgi:hypothetical protein